MIHLNVEHNSTTLLQQLVTVRKMAKNIILLEILGGLYGERKDTLKSLLLKGMEFVVFKWNLFFHRLIDLFN